MATRFFLCSYIDSANFETSRAIGLLGFPEGGDGLSSKVLELQPGDVVIIRDTSRKYLKFHGFCEVTDNPYREATKRSWPDEVGANQLIYPYRVTVKLDHSQLKNLNHITWPDLLKVGLRNQD